MPDRIRASGHLTGQPASEEISDQSALLDAIKSQFGVDDELFAAILASDIHLGRVHRAQLETLKEIRDQREETSLGSFPRDMSHTVPADTPREDPHIIDRVMNEHDAAKITKVSLGWPDGANNRVGIQLRTGSGVELLPRNAEDQYVAFNDYTETFDLVYRLDPGEELVAQTVNLDTTNSHFVNIVPHVEEILSETQRGN